MVWSIIILGVVSTFYTMMGGIKGLLYIDTFQTLLMIFTGVVGLVMVLLANWIVTKVDPDSAMF